MMKQNLSSDKSAGKVFQHGQKFIWSRQLTSCLKKFILFHGLLWEMLQVNDQFSNFAMVFMNINHFISSLPDNTSYQRSRSAEGTPTAYGMWEVNQHLTMHKTNL